MTLLEAIETLLDVTADLSEQPHVRRARKKLQERADTLRVKRQALRERAARLQAFGPCTRCGGKGFTWVPGNDGFPEEKRCSSCDGNGSNRASEATNQPKVP
jgi:DnaJ-class molecular chaperone